MDRIDLFRVFARVVECGSFTRAADALALPRSSVSTAVMELEKRLGVRLLHRTTRKVAPTHDGAVFYERCVNLIEDVEEAEALFRAASRGPAGKVRVDLPGRVGRLIVAPALPEFLDRYPDIEIELGVTDRAVDFVMENVDCALRVGALGDSTLIARPLGELPLINVVSPAYVERFGAPQTPDDLKDHYTVNYASPSTGRAEKWEWMEDGALKSASAPIRVSVNSAEAYIACCLAGLGLIQVPAYDVKGHVERGELIEVMTDYRAAPMPAALLFPHRRHEQRRVRVFADWLEALLKQAMF